MEKSPVCRLQEKLVRAVFSHSLLYPPRPVQSLLDGRLVLPSGAGAPSVGFPPGAQSPASLPLFAPLMTDRDAVGAQLGRCPVGIDDRRSLPPGVTGDGLTDIAARSQWNSVHIKQSK